MLQRSAIAAVALTVAASAQRFSVVMKTYGIGDNEFENKLLKPAPWSTVLGAGASSRDGALSPG